MAIPRSLVAFLGTWACVLLLYSAYVGWYEITTTEPDFKFGEAAPYISLLLLGGLGGFIASLGALFATLAYERAISIVTARRVFKAALVAAGPLALGAWYAADYSPLSTAGTVVAWFWVSAVVFAGCLYIVHPSGDA